MVLHRNCATFIRQEALAHSEEYTPLWRKIFQGLKVPTSECGS